jgi:hypothetical protein
MWHDARPVLKTTHCAPCTKPTIGANCCIQLLWLRELCIPDQQNHSRITYALSIEDMDSRSEGRCSGLFGKKQWNVTHIADNPIPRLHEALQPPLSYPGATPDADRAKRPPLSQSWRWSDDAPWRSKSPKHRPSLS